MSKKKTGVTFGTYHSYTAWGLRLKEVQISFPDAKTVTFEVEGMDGVLDFTEEQNGEVRYTNRTLSFIFDATDCKYTRWTSLISTIANAIHGQSKKITIDFDANYYYEGRCSIDTSKTNEVTAQIVITCDVGPYKTDIQSDGSAWLWDPFPFATGVIHNPYSFTINSAESWQEETVRGYTKNFGIKFTCSAAMQVKYDNTTYDLAAGDQTLEIILEDGANTIYFKGTGTVQVIPRGGML